MRLSIFLATISLFLMVAPIAFAISHAPLDADMISDFQANETEFEFWKNTFTRPDMACWVGLNGSKLKFEGNDHCPIADQHRLVSFMQRTQLKFVSSNDQSGAVGFFVFARGFKGSGADKEFVYDPIAPKQLETNLDQFDAGRLPPGQAKEGGWYRAIKENWYLNYNYSP